MRSLFLARLVTQMINKRYFSKIIAALCTLCLAVACNTTNTGSSNTPNFASGIPLGVAVAQTGGNASLIGQEQVIGAKVAEKFFNDRGGVNNTKIQLIVQDTTGDEQGAINAFNTLINQNKVVGIVGPTLSQHAFSADPIAEQAAVPVVGPSNTAEGIPEIGKYIARVSAPVTVVAPNSVEAALKLNPNLKKVAVLFAQNDAYSKSETEIFQQVVKDKGFELVTVQKFQTTDTDFQTQATAALNLNPDLAIISGLTSDGGNLIKQLRELGYKGLIIGGNGLNTANIFPVCKSLCDGVIIAQAYSSELDTPINKEFREAFKTANQKDPPQFSAQVFTAIQVFVEALKSLDAKTKISTLPLPDLRSKLNEEILAGKYQTPLGEISFTPEGEVVQKQFYVAQVKMEQGGESGKFTFLQ
jgi:branched-chain amino acid transport system substrate-binding protein